MASLQSNAIQAIHDALVLADTDFDAFMNNIQLSLGFEKAHTTIGSKLTALYTCPKTHISFRHLDLTVWADLEDILLHGTQANAFAEWEDQGLNFNAQGISHDDIVILDTKKELVEGMAEMAYFCDELDINHFITDWKQQVVEQAHRFRQ